MKNVLPILADIANGIFATAIAGLVTNTEIVWWHFLIGIPLAMLPDLDALPELFRRGKVSASVYHGYDHRELLHYPLVFVLLGIGLVYAHEFFGVLFLCATMLHFVNDLYGTGWGIPLAWPLTNRRYKLLGRRVNRLKRTLVRTGQWNLITHDERRLRPVVSWTSEELPEYIAQYGVDEWISRYYLRLNWISVTEYLLFVAAVLLAIFVLVY